MLSRSLVCVIDIYHIYRSNIFRILISLSFSHFWRVWLLFTWKYLRLMRLALHIWGRRASKVAIKYTPIWAYTFFNVILIAFLFLFLSNFLLWLSINRCLLIISLIGYLIRASKFSLCFYLFKSTLLNALILFIWRTWTDNNIWCLVSLLLLFIGSILLSIGLSILIIMILTFCTWLAFQRKSSFLLILWNNRLRVATKIALYLI